MQTRDIVVIGSSMGGIEALSTLAAQLPADLPAAVFVVQHMSPESPGGLAAILDRAGPLPAVTAQDGAEIRRGRIHVAPPDRHLLLTATGVRVAFGARENRSRPAIDPLFRTAAVNYRSRVIGVVLTGLLNDGASGLRAVARCGGIPVVQSPADAAFPEMPQEALAAVDGARQARLDELGPLLQRLAAEPAPEPEEVPDSLRIEARLTERAMPDDDWNQVPGRPANLTCPECAGALREIDDARLLRFRCRVGHAYSSQDWLEEKHRSVETSLWVALQTLEERAHMLERMGQDDRVRGRDRNAASYDDRARETRRHASVLREVITGLPG
jgi:two-component system, chemotaxis family, protein-glutamate methylesterase/glutaminase